MEAKLDCDSERIWKIIDKYTPKEKSQKKPESHSIFDNLFNCYINHLSNDKRFRSSTNLLQKLPPECAKVSIIISLYSDETGYSIALNSNGSKEMYLPYENDELFTYLDSGEIPPVLLEVLGKTEDCYMYSGCIICEVRNYRVPYLLISSELNYDSQRILLKPSQETLLMMMNNTMEPCHSKRDKMILESRALIATQPPLCLDPDIDVSCVQNRLHFNRKKFHTTSLRRYLKRQSHARRAIMAQYSERPHPDTLSLDSFIINQPQKNIVDKASKNIPPALKKIKRIISKPCENEEILSEVTKLAKPVKSDILALLEEAVALQTSSDTSNSSNNTTPPIKGKQSPVKGVDDLINTKSTPSPPVTDKPHTPRPLIRPRGVYARPVLPGITVLVGNRPILTRPTGPPQLHPSVPRPPNVSSSSMPALKLLDLKQRGSPTPPPPSSSKAISLPPLKPQSIAIKATPTTSHVTQMPQLHKLQGVTPAVPTSKSAPVVTAPPTGKGKKRKHKH